jgi:hypothetical protein
MVQKVRGLSVKAKSWAEKVRKVLDSATKLSLQDAKNLLEAGEKLKVNSQEIRTLRASLRTARGWTNRVKRCNLELGSVHVSNVRDLIEEYDTFLIEMPDELAMLQQATQSYCVCRRPYSGFMIGCDECEDWYHGPCIGVSESRADRFDKYVCIRCSVKNIFKNSASSAIRIVRKWTSRSERKKARQVEYQKHQRKVRKETKDIEKFIGEIEKLKNILETGQVNPAPSNLVAADAEAKEGGIETTESGKGAAHNGAEHDRGTPTACFLRAVEYIVRFLPVFTDWSSQQEKRKPNCRLLRKLLKMLKIDWKFCRKRMPSANVWIILKTGKQTIFGGGASE